MALTIIRATDPIKVEHPIYHIIGQPGIGKTTLFFSAEAPLLLDFDEGAHRAQNRGDVLQVRSWADIDELPKHKDILAQYQTLGLDTVGRALDLMTLDIMRNEPKLGRDGVLTQQGWGKLKIRFRTWLNELRALGKDIVFLSHDKEEKDGDQRIVRADIAGGSYSELMKIADFVGYLSMAGKDRTLDFSPTDRYCGKNPAQWSPFKVPHYSQDGKFLSGLLVKGRDALGNIGAEQAKVAAELAAWRTKAETAENAEQVNALIPALKSLTPAAVQFQVKEMLVARAKSLGLKPDKAKGGYSDPEPAAEPVAAQA